MSKYAQNLKKLLDEKGEQIDAAFKKATEVAESHRLQHMHDEDGDGYPLVDALTMQGEIIDKGKEEIELLLDSMLVEALMAYEGLLDS